MRKLVMIILVLIPVLSIGQVRVGARAGLQFTTITYKKYENGIGGIIPRLSAGLQLEFSLNDNWFINSGPYYSGKGTIYGRTYQSNKRDSARIHLNYIELPVLFTYRTGDENVHDFKTGAGPYIGYGFLGSLQWKGGRPPTEYNLHKKDNRYKRLDIGFTLVSQYKFNYHWGLRLDFSRSLFIIHRPDDDKDRNLVAGLSLIYQFKKKE